MAARCSFGSHSSAPFTRASNCCCAALDSRSNGITTVFSRISSPAAGLWRRRREMARLRAMTRSHPGNEPRAGIESRGAAPELIENILQDFLRRLRVAKNAVQDGREHPGVAVVEGRQCRFVSLRDFLNQRRVRGRQIRSRFLTSRVCSGSTTEYARASLRIAREKRAARSRGAKCSVTWLVCEGQRAIIARCWGTLEQ